MTNNNQEEIQSKLPRKLTHGFLGKILGRLQHEQDYEKEVDLWQKVNPTRIKEREFWLIEELEKAAMNRIRVPEVSVHL